MGQRLGLGGRGGILVAQLADDLRAPLGREPRALGEDHDRLALVQGRRRGAHHVELLGRVARAAADERERDAVADRVDDRRPQQLGLEHDPQPHVVAVAGQADRQDRVVGRRVAHQQDRRAVAQHLGALDVVGDAVDGGHHPRVPVGPVGLGGERPAVAAPPRQPAAAGQPDAEQEPRAPQLAEDDRADAQVEARQQERPAPQQIDDRQDRHHDRRDAPPHQHRHVQERHRDRAAGQLAVPRVAPDVRPDVDVLDRSGFRTSRGGAGRGRRPGRARHRRGPFRHDHRHDRRPM